MKGLTAPFARCQEVRHIHAGCPRAAPARGLHGCRQQVHVRAAAATAGATDRSKGSDGAAQSRWTRHGPVWGDQAGFPLRQQMMDCTSAGELHQLLRSHADQLQGADVASAWHVGAQGRLLTLARSGDATQAALVEELLQLTDRFAGGMDATALSTTAWALAATSADAGRLYSVMSLSQQRLTTFRPQELCVLLWAAASHVLLPDAQRTLPFAALADLVEHHGMLLEHFSAHDLSVLCWAMGKVHYHHPALLQAAETESEAKVAGLQPPDAARLMHGLAMLSHRPPRLVPPLARRCLDCMGEFCADDVALLMVSLGKLCMDPGADFMKAVAVRATVLAPPISTSRRRGAEAEDPGDMLHPRHMAHLLWSYARLGSKAGDRGFMLRALRHLASHPRLYAGEDINAALWACTRLGLDAPEAVLKAAAQRMTALAPQEPPQILAHVLSSLSALLTRKQDPSPTVSAAVHQFAGAAAELLAAAAGELSAKDVGPVIVALGTLEAASLPENVATRLQVACAAHADAFVPSTLPRITWAVVRLRWRSSRMLDALSAAASVQLGLIKPEVSLFFFDLVVWSFLKVARSLAAVSSVLPAIIFDALENDAQCSEAYPFRCMDSRCRGWCSLRGPLPPRTAPTPPSHRPLPRSARGS